MGCLRAYKGIVMTNVKNILHIVVNTDLFIHSYYWIPVREYVGMENALDQELEVLVSNLAGSLLENPIKWAGRCSSSQSTIRDPE